MGRHMAGVHGEYTVDIIIENHENLFVMSNGSNKNIFSCRQGSIQDNTNEILQTPLEGQNPLAILYIISKTDILIYKNVLISITNKFHGSRLE